MSGEGGKNGKRRGVSIWFFAFGYFAAYIPYSATTKAVSSGLLEGKAPISGFELLPISTLASLVGMLVFLTAMRWWGYAGKAKVLGFEIPAPNRWTFLSGLATAMIIGTTTLAYTFSGVSIVFMMLLMRGGVLVIAPVVDAISGRRVRWFSWMGLLFSLGALVAAFLKDMGFQLTVIAMIDVGLYLASYFFRLRFMSKLAKSDDPKQTIRYFVEEQLVATPTVVTVLAILALIGQGETLLAIRAGYTSVFAAGLGVHVILIGLFSQLTGIFGGLILLGRQENTFCVPVNRSSSILAGVLASTSLTLLFGKAPPSAYELVGAGLIISAILFLTIPPMLERKRAASRP